MALTSLLPDFLVTKLDFVANLARKHSLSPDAKQGGDLGWFERGAMPPIFEQVCFALPEGKVSDVVASSYGFHLFKVIGRRPARHAAWRSSSRS